MIDFHTHIIPNIDDGSKSIDETIELLKEAKKNGFTGIVFTPHYKEKYYETDVHERDVWVDAITKDLRNIENDLDIFLGNEIFITDNIMELLIDEKASTINNSCYVLFELPKDVEPENLYDTIYKLKRNKLIPVLSHPERYIYVQKEPELIYDLIDKGVLMQANYGSILGKYGKNAEFIVRKFLENDMIHFLGSDVHSQNSIYRLIPDALREISNIVGEERLNELTTTNPYLAVNNKKIEIRNPIEFHLTFKEKLNLMFSKK